MAVNKTKNAGRRGASSSTAVQWALEMFQSEAVQSQLRAAPAAVVKWATEQRQHRATQQAKHLVAQLNPASRFGQRGLERRVGKLAEAIALAFGDRATTQRPELWDAVDELEKAIAVAGGLPIVKRKRMHARIDDDLDELEVGLIDAVLPRR